jgi:hypothetical protein
MAPFISQYLLNMMNPWLMAEIRFIQMGLSLSLVKKIKFCSTKDQARINYRRMTLNFLK